MTASPKMPELKACPFCYSLSEFIERGPMGDSEAVSWDVSCKNVDCYLCSGADWWSSTKEEAAKIWNRRTPTAGLREKAKDIHAQVMANRSEILNAFVAKYGLQPDEIEQVFGYEGTSEVWYLRALHPIAGHEGKAEEPEARFRKQFPAVYSAWEAWQSPSASLEDQDDLCAAFQAEIDKVDDIKFLDEYSIAGELLSQAKMGRQRLQATLPPPSTGEK